MNFSLSYFFAFSEHPKIHIFFKCKFCYNKDIFLFRSFGDNISRSVYSICLFEALETTFPEVYIYIPFVFILNIVH